MAFIKAIEILTQTVGFAVSPEVKVCQALMHPEVTWCHWSEVYTCQQSHTRGLPSSCSRLCQVGAVILRHFHPRKSLKSYNQTCHFKIKTPGEMARWVKHLLVKCEDLCFITKPNTIVLREDGRSRQNPQKLIGELA